MRDEDEDGTIVICPTCCGDGEVQATDDGWMDCPACGGTGEKPSAATSRAIRNEDDGC